MPRLGRPLSPLMRRAIQLRKQRDAFNDGMDDVAILAAEFPRLKRTSISTALWRAKKYTEAE